MSGRLRPDYHDYSLRYDHGYAPAHLPRRSKSGSHHRTSEQYGRRQWPPSPKVEEEHIALAREFRPRTSSSGDDDDDDDAPSRGAIDQEPIILEVAESVHDRRFVLVPSEDPFISKGNNSKSNDDENTKINPTPPTSDDERSRRGRNRKAPKLETAGLPEMTREPSPYAWTRPTRAMRNTSSGEFFLSPEALTPPIKSASAGIPRSVPARIPADAPTSAPSGDASTRDTAFRSSVDAPGKGTNSHGRHSPHAQAGTATPGRNHRRSTSTQTRTTSAHSSFARSDSDFDDPTSTRDPAHSSPRTDSSPSISLHSHVASRHSKPAPFESARPSHSRQSSQGYMVRPPHETYPRGVYPPHPPSPPRSPRPYSDRQRDASRHSQTSRATSQSASSHSSPQPSPRLSKSSLAFEALWGSLAAANIAHQPKQSSRLSSHETPPGDTFTRNARDSPSLPYPDEDSTFQPMPSERDHLYFPSEHSANPQMHPKDGSKQYSPFVTPNASAPIPIKRSSLSTRNSALQDLTSSPTSPGMSWVAAPGTSVKPRTPTQIKALARALPHCPRQSYSRHHDDWYTLDGCPGFNICPQCLDAVFGETTYRPYFRPSQARAHVGKGLSIRCDFADAWVRLGWLLTVQRELPSLALIKTLVNPTAPANADEECPGAAEAVRNWYSIRDRDGHFLRGFAVCLADVKRLQSLFPGFRDLWQPLPLRASSSHGTDFAGMMRSCSLRPALNNRYPQYIDTLVRLHEPSYQAGRMPDVSDFVSLVRHKTLLHECTRDDMLREATWHFIPSLLPACTVCEDCYDEVIYPAVESDSDVAMRFNRESQPVYSEGHLGSSCQLYSARMRRIFQRAVRDNDVRYLARKAMDRKDSEDRLQERVAEIRRLARRLEGGSGGYGPDARAQGEIARLDKELNDLSDEWARWE